MPFSSLPERSMWAGGTVSTALDAWLDRHSCQEPLIELTICHPEPQAKDLSASKGRDSSLRPE
jgi:hypothetical protein